MADNEDTSRLTPSVLDRLLGQESGTEGIPRNRTQLLRSLKTALRRDLENLLNTRCRCGSYPPELQELETSLVNYGIPDFTGANVADAGNRLEFLEVVRQSIERYEPRLVQVKIEPVADSNEALDRVLRFRVQAVLSPTIDAEQVVFVSTLEPASGKYHVSGG